MSSNTLPAGRLAQIFGLDHDPMPSSPEVETATLGALLSESSHDTQQAIATLTPAAFHDPVRALIFDAIVTCSAQSGTVDLCAVGQLLQSRGHIRQVGGMAGIVEYTQAIGSGSNLSTLVAILLTAQARRALVVASYQALSTTIEGKRDIEEIQQSLGAQLDTVSLVGTTTGTRHSLDEVAALAIKNIEKRATRHQSGQISGISTGFERLDTWTGGWQSGELIVVAGRPAMGKTALLLHFALSAAKAGTPALVYSLEMSHSSLGTRLLQSMCTVSSTAIKTGAVSSNDWAQLTQAQQALRGLPMTIDERPAVTLHHIATHSRIMHKQGRCGIIFIDYLQLMNMTNKAAGTREREVAITTAGLKELAKELGVPIVLLSQLSRETERRGGSKEPILSDLRESGAIEQDADMVMFVHRPEYYDREGQFFDKFRLSNGTEAHNVPMQGVGKLIIAKYREGATGDVKFQYNRALTQLRDFDESPYVLAPPSPTYPPLAPNTEADFLPF